PSLPLLLFPLLPLPPFHASAPTALSTLSLHDALPILLRLPADPVPAQCPPRSGRSCLYRRLQLVPDPVQSHCPHAAARAGLLRAVPVHVELQRLHGPAALRLHPRQVPHVPVRQAVDGRRYRLRVEPYPGFVPDLHPAAADRLLLCTGPVRRGYLGRRSQGLIPSLSGGAPASR